MSLSSSTKIALLTPLLLTACMAPGAGTGSSSTSSVSSVVSSLAASSSSSSSDIFVTQPAANAVVTSPLTIRGEARGTWYFEASFPVKLLDSNGNQLAIAPAQAQSDWMTTDFVPYEVTLTYTTTSQTGTLVLMKDNPSGEAVNDASISIPVQF